MLTYMERTTVYFDAQLKRRLKEAARRMSSTEAAIVRDAVASYLAGEQRPVVTAVGASADGGIAHRVDEALDELGFGKS